MLVCTAIKNAINGIILRLSFSPGLKFQTVYFKKCSNFWGLPRHPDLAPNFTFWILPCSQGESGQAIKLF